MRLNAGKATLAAVALLAGAVVAIPASAATFTLSDNHGTGPFGEITGFFNNAAMTSYTLHVDMFDNNILNTGGHWPLTLSLNTGTITATATSFAGLGGPTPFTVMPHLNPAGYDNDPFKAFTDAVDGACGNGNSTGGCGQDLWLTVTGVNPLLPLFTAATQKFNGVDVFAAVDIYDNPNGPTFVVGLGAAPTITTFGVPGPIAGAGLPALAAMFGGFMVWRNRRKHLSA
jgi:hypothetical protein